MSLHKKTVCGKQIALIRSFLFLKQFQLLRWIWQWRCVNAPKIDNVGILFVRDLKYADLSGIRYGALHSLYMHLTALKARTMTSIHRILHHGKSIFQELFTKLLRISALFFRVCRQIKKYKQPMIL